MAELLWPVMLPLLDGNGDPINNGYLYFYEEGTTTFKNTFSDSALTVANPNPIRTNASGRPFDGVSTEVDVWGSGRYKLVVHDASDSLIRSSNPYIASGTFTRSETGANGRTVSDKLEERMSLFDFIPSAEQAAIAAGTSTYNATTDIQDAINAAAGRTLYAPTGTYIVTAQLTRSTSGDNPGLVLIGDGPEKTKFDNRVASNAMLLIDGSGTNAKFQFGTRLEGFSIITTTSPASSIGIQIRANWLLKMAQVVINGMSSDGIRVISNDGDNDSSAFWNLSNVRVLSCGGHGFSVPDPATTTPALSMVKITDSIFQSCTGAGLSLLTLGMRIENTTVANNVGGGIIARFFSGTATQKLGVFNCQLEKNTGVHIDAQHCTSFEAEDNTLTYDTDPVVGIRLGDGSSGTAHSAHVGFNWHRRDAGSITFIHIKSGTFGAIIEAQEFSSTTSSTKYNDEGTQTIIRDRNIETGSLMSETTITTSTSYTPDTSVAHYHRVVINATGAFTMNAPTDAVAGKSLFLDVFNASGGAITVTFPSASAGDYTIGGYTDPANGKRVTCEFIYQPDSGRWMQVGSWSPDL